MVTVITTLVEVEQLLAESSVGAGQLEGPQEVSTLLEVGSHGVDLVDQVVHAQDAELAQHLLHLLVLHQRHTLLVQLRVATLVHQHTHRLQVGVSIGDVRLHQTQHLLRGLVQTHEHSVVDLAQTQQLQRLSHLRRGLVDTANTDHDGQTTLALSEQVALSVSLSSLGDQISLHLAITPMLLAHLSVLLLVLLAALDHLLSLGLGGSSHISGNLLSGSLQLRIAALLQNNRLGTREELDAFDIASGIATRSSRLDSRSNHNNGETSFDPPHSLQRTRSRSIQMEDSNISRNGHKVELSPTQALYRREQTNRVEMSEQTGRVDGRGIAVLESCLFECTPVRLGRNRECVGERQRE